MRTKHPDLEDIGFIGDGRSLSDEESKLVSEHIQAYMAKHPAPKRKAIKRGATDKHMRSAVKARPRKAKGAGAKLRTLDEIGFIGGGRPYTDADARAVSAFIQAQKAKRTAAKPVVRRAPAKRSAKAQ